MIRSVIKIGILLVIGIIGYNYFLGNPEEKADAREKVDKIKEASKVIGGALFDLVKDGVALLKEEREKFREGKYDKAVDEVGGLISKIKDEVEGAGGEMLDRVNDLEKQRDTIAEQVKKAKDSVGEISEEQKENLKEQFDELTAKTGEVLEDLEKKN
jgi:chromosome segregation ATPase